MAPHEDGTHYHVNDRIQYLGPDGVPDLRPGEIGRVVENGRPGSVLVQFPNKRRARVTAGDERFRKIVFF